MNTLISINPESELILEADRIYHTEPFNGASNFNIELIDENTIVKKFKILGEEFDLYIDGDNLILSHPKWSLSGMGDTLLEAERNLYQEARELFNYYNSLSDSELTFEAIQLKEFLKRLH